MVGRLALPTSWAQQAVPPDERRDIEARIPDGYTVGLEPLSNRSGFRTYIHDTSGPRVLTLVDAHEWHPKRDVHDAIDRALTWIAEYDSAIYAGVEVKVR